MGVDCMIMLIANCDMCRVTFWWNVRWLTCLCRESSLNWNALCRLWAPSSSV